MAIHLTMEMGFERPVDTHDEEFEGFLEELVAHLDTLGCEVNLAAKLATSEADFATSVDAENFEEATAAFWADLQTALHAAGCGTTEWPAFSPRSRVVRELQDA